MMSFAAKLPRALRICRSLPKLGPPRPLETFGFRFFCESNNPKNSFMANPVAQQMIDYAFSLARSQRSDESYSQSMLVLEQCYSIQADEDSKAMVLLAMSNTLYERGDFGGAIEKLRSIEDLSLSSLAIRVAATEALVGVQLEMDRDDTSSVLTNICYNLLDTIKSEIGDSNGLVVLEARVKTLKGLLELLMGNLKTAESFLLVAQDDEA